MLLPLCYNRKVPKADGCWLSPIVTLNCPKVKYCEETCSVDRNNFNHQDITARYVMLAFSFIIIVIAFIVRLAVPGWQIHEGDNHAKN